MKLLILPLAMLLLSACTTTYPNQKLVGKNFPSVSGTSLDDKKWKIPEDFKGESVLLLIGYKHKSQFDIDRWFIGLDMKETTIPTYEVPTIQGMFPQLFSTLIDEGMRKGIPKPIWKGVITVYKDGDIIQEFTGNENPRSSRVVLLDKEGKVAYFHDSGFSVPDLNQLIQTYDSLNKD
ncbi:MAG: hypothetical protein AB8E15_13390 [Bdellovibrionales bacterium]